VRLIENRYGPK